MQSVRQRNFEFNATKSGLTTRFRVPIKCSRCPNETVFECSKILPDEAVISNLHRRGWLLGRARSSDVCPTCIGVAPENRLADRFKVVSSGQPVPRSRDIVERASVARSRDRSATAALLDRHFPQRAPQAEQPRAAPAPAPEPAQQSTQGSTLEASIERLESRFDTIAAAFELMVEQQQTVIAQQQQQINAIANLASLIGRTNEATGASLYTAASALSSLATAQTQPPRPSAEPAPPPAPQAQPLKILATTPKPRPAPATKPEPIPMKPIPRCKRKTKLSMRIDENLARRAAAAAAPIAPKPTRTRRRRTATPPPTWTPDDIRITH